MLLNAADEMLKLDIGNMLSLRELEIMSKVDNEILKDPSIKNIIGDPVAMVKKLKQE